MHNCGLIFWLCKEKWTKLYFIRAELHVIDRWHHSEGTCLNMSGLTSSNCPVIKTGKPHACSNFMFIIFVTESFQHKSRHLATALFSHYTYRKYSVCFLKKFTDWFCINISSLLPSPFSLLPSLSVNVAYLKSDFLYNLSSCAQVDLKVQGIGIRMPSDFFFWYALK